MVWYDVMWCAAMWHDMVWRAERGEWGTGEGRAVRTEKGGAASGWCPKRVVLAAWLHCCMPG